LAVDAFIIHLTNNTAEQILGRFTTLQFTLREKMLGFTYFRIIGKKEVNISLANNLEAFFLSQEIVCKVFFT